MKTLEIIAEQFRCEIPSPNALKEGVLYCSTNATNAVDIWVAVGTTGSALAAVGLGIWSVIDSRKSHRRADASVQREIASNRRKQLLEYARPILDELEDMTPLAKDKLVDQTGKLTRLASTYEINAGALGPQERKFGESLRSLCNSANYAVAVRLYEGLNSISKPSEMTGLGFQLSHGLIIFDSLVRGSLVELAHAESVRDITEIVERFSISSEAWTEKFEPMLPDDE